MGRLLTFEPTVVVQDGKFLRRNLKSIRYSIDNILQMLREQQVFDISDVETAIVEANGALSVLKKTGKQPITSEEMNLPPTKSTMSYPLIIEGKLYTDVLSDLNLNTSWLNEELKQHGITTTEEVFFASINHNNDLHLSLFDENLCAPRIRN